MERKNDTRRYLSRRLKKTEQEPVDKETTSEDIVIDLTENQESENEDKKN